MPWKEADVVDLREEFVVRALSEGSSFAGLCREYGVSAKTGYKWKRRFIQEGLAGLRDRSRRPHTSPGQLSEQEVCRLVAFKLAHIKWGPAKIREVYRRAHPLCRDISLSTVKRVLGKAGLVRPRRRRRHDQCGRIENPVTPQAPNDLWTVDFKGWWYSCERRRVEPLTVRDAHSRYILCAQPLADSRTQAVRGTFERLFDNFGLPLAIRSDNGPPFASMTSPRGLTRLSAWWVTLGIDLDRISPGHPQDNGAHERMHRDMAMEVEGAVEGDFSAQQAAIELWRGEFNHQRPHEALGMRVPAEVYHKSKRRYEEGPVELEYPAGYQRRRVGRTGAIKIDNCRVGISVAVGGWDVGLQPTRSAQYAVWFGPLYLGQVDLESRSFKAAR